MNLVTLRGQFNLNFKETSSGNVTKLVKGSIVIPFHKLVPDEFKGNDNSCKILYIYSPVTR